MCCGGNRNKTKWNCTQRCKDTTLPKP